MRLYRSIGQQELEMLLSGSVIFGCYNCKIEEQNDCDLLNACCFFVDNVIWKDAEHKFVVVVDIPEDNLMFGEGTYYAAKTLANTRIWTGRRGEQEYRIREAYAPSYSIAHVKEIYLFNYFTDTWVNGRVVPICEKNGIEIFRKGNGNLFSGDERFTVGCDGIFRTIDDVEAWKGQFTYSEHDFVEDTKKLIAEKNLSFAQAKLIRSILASSM